MRWNSIFSDVDGTLINSRFAVTEQTMQALLAAQKAGLRFYIVSARSPSGIRTVMRESGLSCGMIAHSGALAMDEAGQILVDRGMDLRQAGEVLCALQEMKAAFPKDPYTISFFSYDTWIAENRSDPRIREEEGYVKTCAAEGSLEDLTPDKPVHKIMCLCEPAYLDRLEEMVKARFPFLAVVRAWENLLEIKAAGVTKAEAMAALVNRLGLPMEGTIAFGDHHNDIEMLRAAGCGVAMGNAREAVKKAADLVTEDNDHDGIAAALGRLLKEHPLELTSRFTFRPIRADEAEQAALIEQICFPPNEACSPEMMRERALRAPEVFLVAVDRSTGKIAGFLNGIATDETKFRDAFFTDASLHKTDGACVMLCGLDVLPEYRMQGLARALVETYSRIQKERGRRRLVLTCLDSKVGMYQKMGFRDLGEADSSWGGETWHAMDRML